MVACPFLCPRLQVRHSETLSWPWTFLALPLSPAFRTLSCCRRGPRALCLCRPTTAPSDLSDPLPLLSGDPNDCTEPCGSSVPTDGILSFLKSSKPGDALCVLGLTLSDLYPCEAWSFTFGKFLPGHGEPPPRQPPPRPSLPGPSRGRRWEHADGNRCPRTCGRALPAQPWAAAGGPACGSRAS